MRERLPFLSAEAEFHGGIALMPEQLPGFGRALYVATATCEETQEGQVTIDAAHRLYHLGISQGSFTWPQAARFAVLLWIAGGRPQPVY